MSPQEVYEHAIKPLSKTVADFPWENERAYGDFLAQTYHYVLHSTRLLALSASRFLLDEDKLHKRFIDHIMEEKSHELLALGDLKRLGFGLDDFEQKPITRCFYETQYFKIQHQDPSALLGYILALEGISVLSMGEVYQRLIAHYGPKPCSFIKLHAEEDVDHLEKAYGQIGQLSPDQKRWVDLNYVQSCEIYRQILLECAKSAASPKAWLSKEIPLTGFQAER